MGSVNKNMKVYILAPNSTTNDEENINKVMDFLKIVEKQLGCYGIEHYCVRKMNYKKCILKLDNDSIVVIFNGYIDSNDEFFKTAISKNSKIFPVAFGKKNRVPFFFISDKQSFDVYDQLRRRNLASDYVEIPANVFARKIISECMPTICNEDINIFLSHRRLDGEEITKYKSSFRWGENIYGNITTICNTKYKTSTFLFV